MGDVDLLDDDFILGDGVRLLLRVLDDDDVFNCFVAVSFVFFLVGNEGGGEVDLFLCLSVLVLLVVVVDGGGERLMALIGDFLGAVVVTGDVCFLVFFGAGGDADGIRFLFILIGEIVRFLLLLTGVSDLLFFLLITGVSPKEDKEVPRSA